MDPAQRRRLVNDLKQLSRNEFEAVLAEVQAHADAEAAGVAALRRAFEGRAAESPLSSLPGLLAHNDEE
jgi:hypothetical protein